MKYYLIAGEASGDLHGANLMKAIKADDVSAEFRFLGGDKMQEQGGVLVKHYRDMAYMGFVEVVLNLRSILRNMEIAKRDMLTFRPDALVLIDFPGFNLKIAEFAKKHGIKVFYYISPKVWAWNQKRVLKIKQVVDHLYCILPFEVEFFSSWGMKVNYVGNPLLDEIATFKPDPTFIDQQRLNDRPLIALLPGSRRQEVKKLLPDMIAVSAMFPDYRFVIAGAPGLDADFYKKYMYGSNLSLVFNHTYDLLKKARAAIVTSGTATLEAALFSVPQVVVYKANAVTVFVARMLIKVGYISLVNLIMNREVVKELIQKDCNVTKITLVMSRLLNDESYRIKMLQDYKELHERIGSPGASSRAAKLIVKELGIEQRT